MKFYNAPSIEIIKLDTGDIMEWSKGKDADNYEIDIFDI